jgi:transposase
VGGCPATSYLLLGAAGPGVSLIAGSRRQGPRRRRQEVRAIATTTRALLELRDWLVCQGVSLCVMEATSTYWKPPVYLLEDAIECWVVKARDVKNVPGRGPTC